MQTLYYTPSTCSLVVRIVLNELGAEFEEVLVPMNADAETPSSYAELNPLRRVPALRDADGELWTEVAAIITLLARQQPQSKLWPDDPKTQLRAQEWMAILGTQLHPNFRRIYVPQRFTADESAAAQAGIRQAAIAQFDATLAVLEDRLQGRPHALDLGYSVVDPYLYVILRWARAAQRPPVARASQALFRYAATIEARPAVQASLAQEAIDALFTD